MIFQNYDVGDFYDELFLPDGAPRSHARLLVNAIGQLPAESVRSRQHAAEQLLLQLGITFNVYGDAVGTEKIFPFDIIPRAIADLEWRGIEYGLVQRIQALNLFLDDVYHEQRIVRDGIIPGDL
ncbi:MAG: circularly permuted type 2 ATP-grasp protein, partial [Spirochaetota bacterium]